MSKRFPFIPNSDHAEIKPRRIPVPSPDGLDGIPAEQILQYWWMIELFSPQPVPKAKSNVTRAGEETIIEWTPGQPLPWMRGPTPNRHEYPSRVWLHTVYLGVYKVDELYDVIHTAFEDDQEAHREASDRQSASAALVVDQDGRIVPESAVLSSALWATGQVLNHSWYDPNWAYGFYDAQQQFLDAIHDFEESRIRHHDAPELPVLTEDCILKLCAIASKCAGLQDHPKLGTTNVVIRSKLVYEDKHETAQDTDFLNSFFLDELKTVREEVLKGRYGNALATYLTADYELDESNRIDLINNPSIVDDGVVIDRLPHGRWPSNPKHSLALSQQFAVNMALNELGDSSGIIGVNGPPGTGKTTMLRDILAGNLVERAKRLAALSDPKHAITVTVKWYRENGDFREIPYLREELTGFEMVVASSNNAAVENVSTEIPAIDAIDERWQGDAHYFQQMASALLNQTNGDKGNAEDSPSAWGLIAARLGRKANRNEFKNVLLRSPGGRSSNTLTKQELFDAAKDFAREEGGYEWHRFAHRLSIDNVFKIWKDSVWPVKTWQTIRRDFNAALGRVEYLLKERQEAEDRHNTLLRMTRAIEAGSGPIDEIQQQLSQAELMVQQFEKELAKLEANEESARERLNDHIGHKPKWFKMLINPQLRQVWTDERTHYEATLNEAIGVTTACKNELDMRQEAVSALEHERQQAEARLHTQEAEVAAFRAQCAKDKEHYGVAYPGAAETVEDRELRAPWLDEELDAARSALFIEAMRVHEGFLAHQAANMRKWLRAVLDVVTGDAPADLEAEKRKAAWQFLFLLVPLISTTFASLGRMFGDIGQEAIGWLLIDEAGQACPQYAVGGIWRARRVIAVGDPLQLPPVVTAPTKLLRDIAKTYGVSSTWIPPKASVQTLADRVGTVGTSIPQGNEAVWVSAPLRVHRRCDDPMFSICNTIAYNGIMVNGVPPRHKSVFDETPSGSRVHRSCWAHTEADKDGGKVQHQEIKRVVNGLRYLDELGVPLSDVIVISPFKKVAKAVDTALKKELPNASKVVRTGTIHTAQGREADVVFFVLGGDPKCPGAKEWASSEVNLLNVAVSRAKRRLYVMGDRDDWRQYSYFDHLADVLPVVNMPSKEP